MEIKSNDNLLIENLITRVSEIAKIEAERLIIDDKDNLPPISLDRIRKLEFDFPFDTEIKIKINNILPLDNYDSLYRKINELKELWFILIDKAIKCLRYFDTREPYLELAQKKPQSYGLDELKTYYEEFAEFEALLYGSNQFYRDHVIHLFRTWLIGMNILIMTHKYKDDYLYKYFQFEGVLKKEFHFNFFECISIWTIASLCHDLGYPLEKFQSVINRTQKMMEYLVSQPKIQQDINFSGTQDKLNEYIVKLISSKMIKLNSHEKKDHYHARTQSKYYMKYSKSLEDYSHGIISSIIIYKALLYFLESDFSTHEDYIFRHEDAKQFYLRRDILRCIASHTCKDIYHIYSNTFPLLLIICDELQEWGRKRWADFYTKNEMLRTKFTLANYDNNNITIQYAFDKIKTSDVDELLDSFYKQYQKYKKLFRDGQDTVDRVFGFYIIYNLKLVTGKVINVSLSIPDKDTSFIKITGMNYKRKQDFKNAVQKINRLNNIIESGDYHIKLS